MSSRIILRQGARILTPKEYFQLREQLDPNIGYQLIADALLHTGLRVVEFWHLIENPHWYHSSSRVIDLPKEGSAKKARCTITERTIRLTADGCKALDMLFGCKIQFRERDAMGNALKRAAIKAGLGDKGISPKMFRKMLISWLVECRKDLDIDTLDIAASAGHQVDTLKDHYLGIGFTPQDHTDMVSFLRGWKA